MALTTAQKLKIRDGNVILTIHAPADYKKSLGTLPANTTITDSGKDADQIHWFVKNKAELEKELREFMALLKDQVICWMFFPKGTSGIQTDLNRDVAWAALQTNNVQMITLISFDETWSAFGIRQKTETGKKKEALPKPAPVSDYIDSKTKTVKLPEDVTAVLKKKKALFDYFNSLAYSHRKEYVEWILSAKKEETRNQRIQKMAEMLEKKWKNPSNR